MTADVRRPTALGLGDFVLTRIGGVPIIGDARWLLLLVGLAWYLAAKHFPPLAPQQTGAVYLLMGVGSAVGLFGSVLLHELGHVWAARRVGIRTRRVRLHPVGGVAVFEGEAQTAGAEVGIALAGPAMNLIVGGTLVGLAFAVPLPEPVRQALLFVGGWGNLALGAFNLLPGYPLDGGYALHGLVWRALGDPLRAATVLSWVGRVLAAAAAAYALAIAFNQAPGTITTAAGLGYLALLFFRAAHRAVPQAAARQALARLTVADVFVPTDPAIMVDAPASTLRAQFAGLIRPVRVVTDRSGRPVGLIASYDLAEPDEERPDDTVADLMLDLLPETAPIAATARLRLAFDRLTIEGDELIPVTGHAGEIVGLISENDVQTVLAEAMKK